MSYCPTCRRHLNGAFSCAGCGRPAEILPAAAHAPGPEQPPGIADGPSAPPAGTARRGTARRAQRRGRARRRLLLLGAAAVIVCAGIGVLALGSETPTAAVQADAGSPTDGSTASTPDGAPGTPVTGSSPKASHPVVHRSASASPSPGPTGSAGTTAPPTTTSTRPVGAQASTTGLPSTPSRPPTQSATPSPTATACTNRFLWWCTG